MFVPRDENRITGLVGASSSDATVPIAVYVDPSTHRMLVDATVTITSADDNSAFTAGTSEGTVVMGFYHATVDTVTDGRVAAIAITSKRAQHTSLYTPLGDSAMDDTNDAVKVVSATAANFNVTEASAVAIKTAVEIMDDWDETDRAKVNVIVGQAGITAGAGAVAANTPRVTHASDDPAVVALEIIDNAISGSEMQVDVVAPLPAGTNAIGKLAANTGVDIGDVDVTSIVPGTGATNLGKAEDATHTTGDVGVMALGVRTDVPNAVAAGTTGEYSFVGTDMAGGLRTALYETDFAVLGTNHVKKYYTNAGAVTDGIIWSPAAGKRWYVTDIFINVSAAATVTLEDDKAGGDEAVWKAELAANSGWSHHFGTPLFSGEDAADLIVTTSAGNVYITVTGYEI